MILPTPVRLQVVSLSKLYFAAMAPPKQLPPCGLLATMVFVRTGAPANATAMPPPATARFSARVTWRKEPPACVYRPPPAWPAAFPLIVEFVRAIWLGRLA